jgi:hypothetical protein
MTQASFPFEGIDTTETQFSRWARHFNTGVNDVPTGTALQVSAGTGLAVNVAAGEAMVRGHYYTSDAVEALALATANATNPRLDVVVLRLDPTANSIVLAVKTGTPAGSPTAPALVQTDAGIYEEPLANVLVPANSGVPTTITDRREFMGTRLGSWATVGRPTPAGRVLFGFNTTTQTVEFYNTVTSAWQDVTPASLNDIGDVTITSATTGQVLEWNGTAWVNGQVDAAGIASNAVTTAKILDANVTSAKLGPGTILQVVQTVKTDVFTATSVANGAFSAEITGLTATITPRSTSSKILVMYTVSTNATASGKVVSLRLLKGGSPVTAFIGDQLGTNRRRASSGAITGQSGNTNSGMYLDSPNTTSAITYSFDMHHTENGSLTLYVNRGTEGDSVFAATNASSITLMEVAA